MKKWIVCLALLFSTGAFAASGQVERIYPQGSLVHFRLKGDTCKTPQNNKYYTFSVADETGRAWYALLLSAATTKTVVNVSAPACIAEQNQQINYLYVDF